MVQGHQDNTSPQKIMTTLHNIAANLNIEVGTAARIIIKGKAPSVWGNRHSETVEALLSQVTPRLRGQAEFINRRQLSF
jgi:hypothetical protein